ncbi:MAG TPA: DUF4129 domain-containing protein [Mycobacterium sp.]|nr:DUF4129 domain-containing protein [Mycobacterium sp.]
MATVSIDRDAAHDAAQRELSKPIYPKPDFLQRISDWIDDLISRLVVKSAHVPGGWFTVALLVTLVVIALIVAVWIARRTLRTNRRGELDLFGDVELSAAEHRATAERYAAEGDWAAAIRHRLRAVARQLEENGVLNPVPGRTASELARDAGRSMPDLAPQLASAAGSFNDVTYGEQLGSEPAYLEIAALDEQIRHRRPSGMTDGTPDAESDSWAHLQ